MSSWSKRRKLIYIAIMVAGLIVIVGIPGFLIFYKAPTCYDNIQNGGEQGVDCGGGCVKLCASSFLPPIVAWRRYEQIAPGIYNLAAYIINQNTDGEATNVPYHMIMYDKDGVPISDTASFVTLPPHRNTLAFIGAVNVSKSIPAVSPFFEFSSPLPDWHKRSDPLSNLIIGEKKYTEDESGSYFQVVLKNESVNQIYNIAVYVVLYDQDKNAIGFSRTVLDEIPAMGEVIAPFTWPINRHGAVISQEVLPVAE